MNMICVINSFPDVVCLVETAHCGEEQLSHI